MTSPTPSLSRLREVAPELEKQIRVAGTAGLAYGTSAKRDARKWYGELLAAEESLATTLLSLLERVERVQAITNDDCRAEGMQAPDPHTTVRAAYAELWDSLNASRGYGWDANPWVWVIEFKRSAAFPTTET